MQTKKFAASAPGEQAGANSVRITVQRSAARNNPVALFFMRLMGHTTFDVRTVSVVYYAHEEKGEGTVRCPAGKTARYRVQKAKGLLFRFAEEDCGACKLKERCIGGPRGARRRSVSLPYEHRELDQVRDYMKTESFKEEMKRRRGIEPKIAELVRWHGMRRARYRGLAKVNLQCLFTALVVNIKRWFNLRRARAPALAHV